MKSNSKRHKNTYYKKEISFLGASSTLRFSKSEVLAYFLFWDPGVLTVRSIEDLFGGREDEVFSFLTTSWPPNMAKLI